VFFHLGDVFVQIATAEDAAVDFRMQGFHAAVEHFGNDGDDVDAHAVFVVLW